MANSVDPDIGAVCSGFTLFASMLNSSVMLGNYLQQTNSADDIFRCIFILGALRVKSVNWQIIDTTNAILAILLIMPMKYVADGSIQNSNKSPHSVVFLNFILLQ